MFVVIDSIDGGGCETQSKLVSEKLREKAKNPQLFKYPNYESSVGPIIKDFLYNNKDLSVEKQFLLYSLQFIFDAESIKQHAADGVAMADRYFTTTLVFQTLQGFPEKTALQFADDFGIIKPDYVFFLDVSPETAYKWKHGEDKVLNFWEKDLEFMKKTYDRFSQMSNSNTWTNWVRINGERSKEEVAEDIVERITKL